MCDRGRLMAENVEELKTKLATAEKALATYRLRDKVIAYGSNRGMHLSAAADATRRVAENLKREDFDKDWKVHDEVEKLRKDAPHLFTSESNRPPHPFSGKRTYQGYTTEQLMKIDPRKRLSIINGEKQAKL